MDTFKDWNEQHQGDICQDDYEHITQTGRYAHFLMALPGELIETEDRDEAAAMTYGFLIAQAGEAWTVNGGIGIREDGAVRLATVDEDKGVRAYWQAAGITG